MATSQLNTNTISDFLGWHDKGELILNPDFQRRRVWSSPAKVFLIDTILRDLSIPKFYIRTMIDLESRKSIREVVDGQQRLSAIIDFANDKLILTKRAGDLEGVKYSTLTPELKERFLKYTLAVEHLINAKDEDVLEVFSRLNSYGETLNAAEKRHAEYQGEFKWAVRNVSRKYTKAWSEYKILGLQQQVRMLDDALVAQLVGMLVDGVRDGGDPYIQKLYKTYDEKFPNKTLIEERTSTVMSTLLQDYGDILKAGLGRSPQILILFAALAHSLYGIPKGDLSELPPRKALKSPSEISISMNRLLAALDSSDPSDLPPDLSRFVTASKSTTQRIKSREVRFRAFYSALTE